MPLLMNILIVRDKLMKNAARYFFILFFCFTSVERTMAQTVAAKTCGYFSAGKLKIYYCEQGKGPAIIFLHAGVLDMHMWDKQADSLAKDHRVISMDLPGHGQTIGTDTSIRISEVINLLMKRLNVPIASFAGISLGAACTIDFAIAHPEKVLRLVLCSPGVNGWEDVMKSDTLSKRVFVRSDTFLNTNAPDLVTENFVHYWLDGPYRDAAPVDASVRAYVFNTALDKTKRRIPGGPVFDKRKAAKRVSLIRKPVLILYGSLDIPFISQISNYLHKKIKNSQVQVIDAAAHLFVLEKPEVVTQYLRSWIK
jgi:pimeloyl-ACP methyl ester carboxylesterase